MVPPSSSSTCARMISSKEVSAAKPSEIARLASKFCGQPSTIFAIDRIRFMADQLHRLVAGDAAQRLDLLADGCRQPRHAERALAAERPPSRVQPHCIRKHAPPRAGWRTSGAHSRRPEARPPVPDSGSRSMLEKKPDAALLGLPGRITDCRQAECRCRRRSRAANSRRAAIRRSPSACRSW